MPGAFDFRARTRIVFGDGALVRLGELVRALGARRVVLVSDPGLAAAGHVARAQAGLEAAGCEVAVWTETREDPDARCAARCAEVLRARAPELLVALGGGSAIDTAKGGAILAANGGRMQDYWGYGKTRAPLLPLVAVPTTAGTGSEVQSFALIADEETGQKMAIGADDVAPRVALLDPELSLTCPPLVTACAGLDALGHALETAVTTRRNPLSELFSREAFRRLVRGFAGVQARADDRAARGELLLGATWAGLAIEHSMLGAAHALANPLSARLGLTHGLAVGLALPVVVRLNGERPAERALYAGLARDAGLAPPELDEAQALARLLDFLARALEAPGAARAEARTALRGADLGALAEEASRQWTGQFNPTPLDRAGFARLYAELRDS